MKYKVGDEVRIKGTDIGGTIESIIRGQLIVETKGSKIPVWPEEVVLIEGLVEEEEIEFTEEDKYWCDIMSESDPTTYVLPEGYIFKDENGNVINTTKIVLEKKKKEYPKTYEECCEVLFEDISYAEFTFVPAKISSVNLSYIKGDFVTDLPSKVIPYEEKLNMFYKLLICRDAYWKIAGEEMGLSGSWKPDFASCKIKYAITYYNNVVSRYSEVDYNSAILVFPTEEMRDAFKENFDPDIEICKELL